MHEALNTFMDTSRRLPSEDGYDIASEAVPYHGLT